MRKFSLFVIAGLLIQLWGNAQSKVFKEVSEDISSRVAPIRQDNELVGYLVFTQLEKVSEDSFNYRIAIVDENLNDISAMDFREQSLYLQNISLEQDVLCIAYLKTNIVGKTFKNKSEYHAYIREHSTNNDLLLQFLNISGKLLNRVSIPMDLNFKEVETDGRKVQVISSIREEIQLRNVPQHGFAVFYGEVDKNVLSVYRPDGSLSWKKAIKDNALDYVILPSGRDVYMLMRKTGSMIQGDYELARYDIKDSITYYKRKVNGKNGNTLGAIVFNNDPVTGMPVLSGFIVHIHSVYHTITYKGLFTFNFDWNIDADPVAVLSYWDDEAQSSLPKEYKKASSPATFSFKDYEGNTYFTGISFTENLRKANEQNSILLKQDPNGVLSVAVSIPYSTKGTEQAPGDRFYSTVFNKQAKACYFIAGDEKNTSIYDIGKKRIARTIPRKDGDSRISIFPAKEGSIMVSEYNKKEKYTRISIEAL